MLDPETRASRQRGPIRNEWGAREGARSPSSSTTALVVRRSFFPLPPGLFPPFDNRISATGASRIRSGKKIQNQGPSLQLTELFPPGSPYSVGYMATAAAGLHRDGLMGTSPNWAADDSRTSKAGHNHNNLRRRGHWTIRRAEKAYSGRSSVGIWAVRRPMSSQ